MNSRLFLSRFSRHLSLLNSCKQPLCFHVRSLGVIPFPPISTNYLVTKQCPPNLQAYRYKSKKKSKKQEVQEEESDAEEEEEDQELEESPDGALPGQKEKILKTAQLRLDKVMRLAMQSSKVVEAAFLEGRLRKNDEKVFKKATDINENDVIDIELGPDPKSPNFIKVHRVEILEIKEGVHCYVRVLISKNLTVKPYE